MSNKRIYADEMVNEIEQILKEYKQLIDLDVEKSLKEACDGIVKDLKANSPKDTGKYASEWSHRAKKGRNKSGRVVYNKKFWMLTHLLEYGHAKANGGFVPGKPHILPAANKGYEEAYEKILERI